MKSLAIIPRYIEQSGWWQHVPIAHWIIAEIKPAIAVELGTHYGYHFSHSARQLRHLLLNALCTRLIAGRG